MNSSLCRYQLFNCFRRLALCLHVRSCSISALRWLKNGKGNRITSAEKRLKIYRIPSSTLEVLFAMEISNEIMISEPRLCAETPNAPLRCETFKEQ